MASAASISERTGAEWKSYVLPFAVWAAFLVIHPIANVPQWARFTIEAVLIYGVSRSALVWASGRPLASVMVGVIVFFIWIGPDVFFSTYRNLPLFYNSLVGRVNFAVPGPELRSPWFLSFRVLNSVLIIPILEELFWRGFLLRWLVNKDFTTVSLGTWTTESILLVAVLFASEHGPFWDVGLAAGLIYNFWMVRTRNLWDCIIAHATTNACLATYVISAGKWQYWL